MAFRLSPELLARVDAYASRPMSEHPGLTLSRTDAVRTLLTRALDDAGIPPLSARRKRA